MKTLFKRTNTGAVQIWRQEFNETGNGYRTISGQHDGKHVISEWTLCEGKNQGRSNATTPEEQARLEVEANYTKKLAQGRYYESAEAIDEEGYFEPMLAEEYDDYMPDSVLYEKGMVYSQPKLDGHRCILRSTGAWTRKGKPIFTVPHILKLFEPVFMKHESATFDGELYNHDLHDNLPEIMSLVRKQKPTQADLDDSEKRVQYWMYDLNGPQKFSDRINDLVETLAESDLIREGLSLSLVPTTNVSSQDHLDTLFNKYLVKKFEGQIVRIDGTPYENKRTQALLKRKKFQTAEFEIVEIIEGEGNRSGMIGAVLCRMTDGKTFKAQPLGKVDYLRAMFERRASLVRKQVTVKFFKLTPKGIPLYPKAILFHERERDT